MRLKLSVTLLVLLLVHAIPLGKCYAFSIKVTENGIFLPCKIQGQKGFCKLDMGTNLSFLLPLCDVRGKIIGKACFSGDQNHPICGEVLVVKNMSFPGIKYRNEKFARHPVDLYDFLDFKVLAIVGRGIFDKRILKMDLANNRMSILRRNDAVDNGGKLPFSNYDGKMFVDTTFAGLRAAALMDIGASISVVNEKFYQKNRGHFKIQDTIDTLDATGVKKRVPTVLLKGMTVNIDFISDSIAISKP